MIAADVLERLLGVDRLIHEPARLSLLACLYVIREADFVFLQNETGLSAGNISSHMRKLEQAGYVKVHKTFSGRRPQTRFRMTAAGRRAFSGYLETIGEVLEQVEEP
jgi:predicted ArsR family transcriptional regulator